MIVQVVICGHWSQDIVPQCEGLRTQPRKLQSWAETSKLLFFIFPSRAGRYQKFDTRKTRGAVQLMGELPLGYIW